MIIKSLAEVIGDRVLVSVEPDTTVSQACEVLSDKGIGALAVLDGERLAGIMSERDVIKRCIAKGRDPKQSYVRDIMTASPVTIHRQETLSEAQGKMLAGGFRHLPVVASDQTVVGMISMRDIPAEYRLMAQRFQSYRTQRLSA